MAVEQKLIVLVERPDGSTYEQEIEWNDGETVKRAIGRFKKMIGRYYIVCDWYIIQ